MNETQQAIQFATNQELITELTKRKTFQGVVVYALGDPVDQMRYRQKGPQPVATLSSVNDPQELANFLYGSLLAIKAQFPEIEEWETDDDDDDDDDEWNKFPY